MPNRKVVIENETGTGLGTRVYIIEGKHKIELPKVCKIKINDITTDGFISADITILVDELNILCNQSYISEDDGAVNGAPAQN